MPDEPARPVPELPSPAPSPDRAPHIVFHELAQGGKLVTIEHHGQIYHLRLTRNDKLILSK